MDFPEYMELVRKYDPNRLKTTHKEIGKELYVVYDSGVSGEASAVFHTIGGVREWIKKRIPENEKVENVEKFYNEKGILLLPTFHIYKIHITEIEPIDLEQILKEDNY